METVLDAVAWLSVRWVDVAIVFTLLLTTVLGYRSGFIWQAIRIASVVAAFWVAARFHPLVAIRLARDMSESARLGVSFVGLFVGSLLVAYLTMFLVREPIDALEPETGDRVLGALIGMAKGLLLCGIAALAVLQFGDELGDVRRAVRESPSARIVVECARALWFGMPQT